MLTSDILGKWFLIENRAVDGLGQGELLQSAASSSQFKAFLILNSYESKCFRDWLSQRWKSKSLEHTSIFENDHSRLVISLVLSAPHLLDAKQKFQNWLTCVAEARALNEKSRL